MMRSGRVARAAMPTPNSIQSVPSQPGVRVLSGNQQSELQRWRAEFTGEEDGQRVNQDFAQQAAAQVPQIVRPDPLDGAAIHKPAEDDINAVAHPTQQPAP